MVPGGPFVCLNIRTSLKKQVEEKNWIVCKPLPISAPDKVIKTDLSTKDFSVGCVLQNLFSIFAMKTPLMFSCSLRFFA